MSELKIVLDLNKSINNYDWENKEELKEHLKDCLNMSWELFKQLQLDDTTDTDYLNRLYDILDLFNAFEIIEKGEKNDGK